MRDAKLVHFRYISLVLACIYFFATDSYAIKLKLASEEDCDRYSLDALYYEKYKLVTEDIFADSSEFVSRVTDLIAESMIEVMANLPGKDSSDSEEKKIFLSFQEMKRLFVKKVEKIKANITTSWESLISTNMNLMLDNGQSSLQDFVDKTMVFAETYQNSRKLLDESMRNVISPIKGIIRNGIDGIIAVAQSELRKEQKKTVNATTDEETESSTEADAKQNSTHPQNQNISSSDPKTRLREKMKEVVKDLVPHFLGKVNTVVLERNVDLEKEIEIKSENRDSVLEDLLFDITLIKTRVNSIIHKDLPKNKEGRDLARRNLYMYWSNLVNDMYKEKMKARQRAPSSKPYRRQSNTWRNEDDLADTLVSLMEIYP